MQGPKAAAALQTLTDVDLSSIPYYSFVQGTFAGAPNVIISATGYTGAGGFELYVPNETPATVWEKIMAAGQAFGIKPIGLGARDTLRLEMGYCLYGNDIDDTTSPLEAGLGWITKFTKDFTNADNLKKQKEQGVSRKLVGFLMDGGGIPRSHYELVDEAGKQNRRSHFRHAVAIAGQRHWHGLRKNGAQHARQQGFRADARQKPARYGREAAVCTKGTEEVKNLCH